MSFYQKIFRFADSDTDFRKFMWESQVELMRMVWHNQGEIADLKMKLGRVDKKQTAMQPHMDGIDGLLGILNLKLPFFLKEDFDIFEEKMTENKFFMKTVSHRKFNNIYMLIFYDDDISKFFSRCMLWCRI